MATELRHPLAHYKAGRPRSSIHTMYFNGCFYARLNNGPMTITYKPVDGIAGGPNSPHFKFWNWPTPPYMMLHPNGRGFTLARGYTREYARWRGTR